MLLQLPPKVLLLTLFCLGTVAHNLKINQLYNIGIISFNPILPGGEGADSAFFFHHTETAQAMKLKLSDFKDTCLRHILQVIPGCYILRCHHANKITKGTLQNLTQ